jgi:RNase PH-related exoribonuclease
LPTRGVPVSCTAVKINGNVVLDPCSEEEKIADARLTVVMDENLAMRAMQKGLSGKFTIEEIRKTIDVMSRKSRELREIIVGGEKYEQKN